MARRKRSRARMLAPRELDIPDDLVESFLSFETAHRVVGRFQMMAVACVQSATTDGLFISVGGTREAYTTICTNMRHRLVVLLPKERMPKHPKYRFIELQPPAATMRDVRERYDKHISALHLDGHVDITLSMLGDKLVPGSIVFGTMPIMIDFYQWSKDNGRKLYALARSLDPVGFAAMLAN